jgi:hypothetical protein
MKIRTIAGKWFSLGIHVDFQHHRVEIHFIWWVLIIGNTKEEIYCGKCGRELNDVEDMCLCDKT